MQSALNPTHMLVLGKITNTVVLNLFYSSANLKYVTYSQRKQWLMSLVTFSLEGGKAYPLSEVYQNLGA